MNKNVLVEELNRAGIIVLSYEFTQSGYVMELKLRPEKGIGWEEIENLPIVGLEMVKFRPTGTYTAKVLFIPSNSKEFIDYVRKHMKLYGLGKPSALQDLNDTVARHGKKMTKISVTEYLRKNDFLT